MIVKIVDNEIALNGTFYSVLDSSPGRFFQHDKNGMFIISAMKKGIPVDRPYEEFTPEQKERYKIGLKKMEELKADVRKEGLGYIESLGGYPMHEESNGELYDVHELSLIVPRNPKIMDEEEFVDFAIELLKKYDQQAVLVSGISFIENGQPRYLNASDITNYKVDPDPDFEFNNLSMKKEFDPKKNPYYTRFKKGGKETFVYSKDSENPLKKYFAFHSPHGWAANCAAGQKGEIIIK